MMLFSSDMVNDLNLALDIVRENPHVNKTYGILPLEFVMLAQMDLSLDFIWTFVEKSVDIGEQTR